MNADKRYRHVISKPVKVDFYTKSGEQVRFDARRTFKGGPVNKKKTSKRHSKEPTVPVTVTFNADKYEPVIVLARVPRKDVEAIRSVFIILKWAFE